MEDILDDSLSGSQSAFSKEDQIVLAHTFLNPTHVQLAGLKLRSLDIPHYFADHHFALNENVLGGQRLFVRKQDMGQVAAALSAIIPDPYTGMEDWYKQTRTQQSYQRYQYLTLALWGLIALVVAILLAYFLLRN